MASQGKCVLALGDMRVSKVFVRFYPHLQHAAACSTLLPKLGISEAFQISVLCFLMALIFHCFNLHLL